MEQEQFIPKSPGAFPDRIDLRDYQYSDIILGAAPVVDWEKGYNVEDELGIKLKIDWQGCSSSCVAQAYSKYAETLNYYEEKQYVDLSASFIYSQIYLPQGGAYLRDGARLLVNYGISKESSLPSYRPDGIPLTESEYRDQSNHITQEIRDEAIIYQSKLYASIGSASIDSVADAIQRNHGAVTGAKGSNPGWVKPEVRPPLSGEDTWGHAIFLNGYGQDDRGKYVKFINSWSKHWGDNGQGKIYEDYFSTGNLFAVWTLVDKENLKKELMIEAIKLANAPEIYAKSKNDNKIYHIGGFESYQELKRSGWLKDNPAVVDSLDGYEIYPLPFGFVKKIDGEIGSIQ